MIGLIISSRSGPKLPEVRSGRPARRRYRRPGIESLEKRPQLSTLIGRFLSVNLAPIGEPRNRFAVLSKKVTTEGQTVSIPIRIDAGSFDLPATGHVLLDFSASAFGNGQIALSLMDVAPQNR